MNTEYTATQEELFAKDELALQIQATIKANVDSQLFTAWSEYCSRPIPAILDAKGHFGLFASYESGHQAFTERAKGLGLGVIQRTRCEEKVVYVATIITHNAGGLFDTGEVAMPVNKNDCAAYAASISWAKRVSLFVGCFLPSADPDDEGKPVEKVKKSAPFTSLSVPPTSNPLQKPPTITEQFAAADDVEKLIALRDGFAAKMNGDAEKLNKLTSLYEARILEIENAKLSTDKPI